jgi:hypothetical protein
MGARDTETRDKETKRHERKGDKGTQTDKQTNRQTDKQTNRQTDKQTKRQAQDTKRQEKAFLRDDRALLTKSL